MFPMIWEPPSNGRCESVLDFSEHQQLWVFRSGRTYCSKRGRWLAQITIVALCPSEKWLDSPWQTRHNTAILFFGCLWARIEGVNYRYVVLTLHEQHAFANPHHSPHTRRYNIQVTTEQRSNNSSINQSVSTSITVGIKMNRIATNLLTARI